MSVLDKKDFDSLKKAQKDIEETKNRIKLAKQAGIDMSQQEKVLNDYDVKVRALLQTYFPGK